MLKVGIIGSGFGVRGLLPAFSLIKNCKIIAMCAKKSEQLVSYCKGADINFYTDWRLLLGKENLDALAIAVTPNAQHQIAKAAILQGLHVFAEKPLAASLSQAKELLALAKRKKIVHGVDFIFPEIAEWEKAKELIDRKTFGRLKHVLVNLDFWGGDIKNKKKSWKTSVAEGGGALSFYFSHGLYYLEHFAGKITDAKSLFVYSPESINGGEVGVDMLLKFLGGVSGLAHVACNYRGPMRHQLIFQCEKGTIVLENKNALVDNFVINTYGRDGSRRLKVPKDRSFKNEDKIVKIVRKLAAKFVNSCINKKQMVPSFKEGVRVQELTEMIRAQKL